MAAICEGRPSVAALMSGISSRVTRYYVTAQETAERDAAVGSVAFGAIVVTSLGMAAQRSKPIETLCVTIENASLVLCAGPGIARGVPAG